ncbi:acyltransferase family protein [Bacillus marasmi]|uniref:acyltransferase family protein n=1 Tax=Bacillus marasmi TaxID=1926279 RepID=UPI0011C87F1C|nr:acyltransferase family protein [Bacillus marasmi]
MNTREAYYDNAKSILVFLMVFGHLIQSYIQDSKLIFTVYTTIYSFHMPAFILISGYFAKGFRKKGYLLKVAKKLIIPYIIFQGMYASYYYFLQHKKELIFDPLIPEWSLWFLISLFCWNVLLFLFAKWKSFIALALAISVGIMVGYIEGINDFLSLSRTFVFFPLFLLGFFFKKENFERLLTKKIKLSSIIVFLTLLLIFYLIPDFNYKWLFGSKPYEDFDVNGAYGGLIRLGIYGLTLLATLSFFAFVPKGHYFFTKWGTRSLYVYLLHGFFIKYFRSSEYKELLSEPWQVLMMSVIALFIIVILSSNAINAITQPLIELKISTLKSYGHKVYEKLKTQKLLPNQVEEQGTFE